MNWFRQSVVAMVFVQSKWAWAQCSVVGCFNRPQLMGYIQKLQHTNALQAEKMRALTHMASTKQNLPLDAATQWSMQLKSWIAFNVSMLQQTWQTQVGFGGMSGILILLASIVFWSFLVWNVVGSELYDRFLGQSLNRDKQNQIKMDTGADPDEFDYLASSEAVPAKLDLARAYLQMEDFASAKKVLQEILTQGNIQQRDYAAQLLTQIED